MSGLDTETADREPDRTDALRAGNPRRGRPDLGSASQAKAESRTHSLRCSACQVQAVAYLDGMQIEDAGGSSTTACAPPTWRCATAAGRARRGRRGRRGEGTRRQWKPHERGMNRGARLQDQRRSRSRPSRPSRPRRRSCRVLATSTAVATVSSVRSQTRITGPPAGAFRGGAPLASPRRRWSRRNSSHRPRRAARARLSARSRGSGTAPSPGRAGRADGRRGTARPLGR